MTRRVREGECDLLVPDTAEPRGPKSKRVEVFFNPDMEFARDVSVLVVERLCEGREMEALDGLAGCGARGVRLAREIRGDIKVTVNDRKERAFGLIRENIAANAPDNAEASNRDFSALLYDFPSRFDYIDIDPFGTPVPYLEAAIQRVRRGGTIGVTATDTAPLCGTYPAVCERRYMAKAMKGTPFYAESGLRLLVGYCVRLAARYDMGLFPVLSHASDHYFRAYMTSKNGVSAARDALAMVGYIDYDPETGERVVVEGAGSTGPLWVGPIHHEEFISGMRTRGSLGTLRRVDRHLELWRDEASLPPYHYTIDEVSKRMKVSPPPLADVLEGLVERGFAVSRTHFAPTGFKTDAGMGDIRDVFAHLGP